jgi:hypothetical protein
MTTETHELSTTIEMPVLIVETQPAHQRTVTVSKVAEVPVEDLLVGVVRLIGGNVSSVARVGDYLKARNIHSAALANTAAGMGKSAMGGLRRLQGLLNPARNNAVTASDNAKRQVTEL